jgi:hypothetical protein
MRRVGRLAKVSTVSLAIVGVTVLWWQGLIKRPSAMRKSTRPM